MGNEPLSDSPRRPSNHAADGWKKTDDETEPLSDSRAVRLLRAKAAELEARVLAEHEYHGGVTAADALAADVALIAGLLADHIERHHADG